MNYSEAAYFDGNHCSHVAAWADQVFWAKRVARCLAQADRRKTDIFTPVERRRVNGTH